jgi:hypothetical protein
LIPAYIAKDCLPSVETPSVAERTFELKETDAIAMLTSCPLAMSENCVEADLNNSIDPGFAHEHIGEYSRSFPLSVLCQYEA